MGTYYNIDAILTDAEKVPCSFGLDLKGMGWLDESPGDDITAGNPVHVPLYLATLLAVQRLPSTTSTNPQPLCTLDIPPSVAGTPQLNALKADPRVLDLRGWCTHYYDLAGRVLELWDLADEEPDGGGGDSGLEAVLKRAWSLRCAEIGDLARGSIGNTAIGGGDLVRRLDERELALYKGTREGSRALREWMGDIKQRH